MLKSMLTLILVGAFVLLALVVEAWRVRYPQARMRAWPIVVLLLVLTLVMIAAAHARDLGQWDTTSQQIRQWYQTLMQPDNPTVPCCGEGDAYWADSFDVDDDKYVAIITDPRPDEPLKRAHIEIGTRVLIPSGKIKYDQSNPTGHGIVFMARYDNGGETVYCYLPPGGV